jgi:hypothetical protein
LRRIIIIGAALAVTVGVGVAYAAGLNKYTAKVTFTSSKPGSTSKPVSIGYTETLSAANDDSTKLAAPLIDIKTTIYGLRSNLKDFKTCSKSAIEKGPKYNANCPKGSEVASGSVAAKLGSPALTPPGTDCKPDLAIYNAGGGKEWYFFTAASATQCGGLTTGQTDPYPGFVKQQGKNLVIDVPLPPFVSTAVANTQGLYGSLIHETVKTFPLTTKVKGKTVGATEAVACLKGKRAYSISFTATDSTGKKETKKVSGSAKC